MDDHAWTPPDALPPPSGGAPWTPPSAPPPPGGGAPNHAPVPPVPYGGAAPRPYGGAAPTPPYGGAPQSYGGDVPAYGGAYPPAYGWPGPPRRRGWAAETPPGVRYHRMARNSAHRWWRPLLGSLMLCVTGMGALLALGVVGFLAYAAQHDGRLPQPSGDSIFRNPTADLALELASLAVLTPVVFLAAWTAQRRRPGTLSSVAGRLRKRWLAACCLLALAFLALSFGWSYLVTIWFTGETWTWPAWNGWDGFAVPAIVIVLLVPLQATAEEYLFRGWLLQAIASWVPLKWTGLPGRTLAFLPAVLASSVLFMLGHGYEGWGRLDVLLFGLTTAWLAIRTGGLEAGIALHVFNNLWAFMIPAAAGQLADSLHQGGEPWQSFVADAVPLLAYVLLVLALARLARLRNTTERPPATRPPAPALA